MVREDDTCVSGRTMNSLLASLPSNPHSGPRRLHQERDDAELVQREEAGVGRPRLNGERRFELQEVQQVGLGEAGGRGQTEELRGIGAGLEQRGWRQLASGITRGDRARLSKSCRRKRVLQLAEDEVVRLVDADLP